MGVNLVNISYVRYAYAVTSFRKNMQKTLFHFKKEKKPEERAFKPFSYI